MATATFGDKNQYTYNVDSKGVPYGAPIATPTLPQTEAPTNVGNINVIPEITLPNVPTKPGDISKAISTTEGSKTRLSDMEKQIADYTAENYSTTGSMISKLLGQDRSKIREEAYDKLGISSEQYLSDRKVMLSEIDSLNQDYTKKEAEMERRIMELEKNPQGMVQGVLDQRVDDLRRSYSIELNAKSAYIKSKSSMLQALDGNFELARDLANDAVEDATADQKMKLDATMMFYDMYKDVISTLDAPYQRAMKESLLKEERDYDQSVRDAEFKRDLMLENPNAKITQNDSIDQAIKKFNMAGGKDGASITTMGGGVEDVIMESLINGATPEAAAREAIMTLENMGIQTDRDDLTRYTEYARNTQKTLTIPSTTETTTPVEPTRVERASTRAQTLRYLPEAIGETLLENRARLDARTREKNLATKTFINELFGW